jgi:hypothetical protein
MSYTLTTKHLQRLCDINAFAIPADAMVFFGLRGCLPTDPSDHTFRNQQTMLDFTAPNYVNPHCTLGQWLPADDTFAVYPASTVPTRRYVASAREKGGVGTNEMMTGCYKDYRKGPHKAGSGSGHDAFRQNADRPHRRSRDDLDYDPEDRVEIGNPSDNLHAAYCSSIGGEHSSAGCQVVVGQPNRNDGACKESGPWKAFRQAAYARKNQSVFWYFLLGGWEAQRVSGLNGAKSAALLRFGSSGDLVTKVQKALQAKKVYEGTVDDDFGGRTLKAVLAFQETTFGSGGDDGIVGPATAEALGIKAWPSV